jgi:hypothetical protein
MFLLLSQNLLSCIEDARLDTNIELHEHDARGAFFSGF